MATYVITIVFDSKEDAEWLDAHLSELAGFKEKKAVEEFKGNWGSAVELTEDEEKGLLKGDVK